MKEFMNKDFLLNTQTAKDIYYKYADMTKIPVLDYHCHINQKEIYEAYVLENYSLAEIAQEWDISRQGVHDIIKRCNAALEEYEAKLHLVEKFLKIKAEVSSIKKCSDVEEARQIADQILDEF